jgi:polar amino acid transport system substrate-binding protein
LIDFAIEEKRKKMKRFWGYRALSLLVLIAMVLALVTACGSESEEEQVAVSKSKVDQILEAGVLKVGLDIFVPWAFKDKDGNLVGFEVDVANKLAQDMGVDVEFMVTEWSGIIPALLTNKFDVVIGGMGITTERALKVNFSIPYEYSGMDFVVNTKMLPGITSVEELNRDDIIIATRLGTTAAEAAARVAPNATLHLFDTDEAIIQDVLNGNAHAAMESAPSPAFWAYDYPDAVYQPLGGELFTKEPCAFVVQRGDPDTVFFFNAWITENEQWLIERDHYWYKTREWEPLLGE